MMIAHSAIYERNFKLNSSLASVLASVCFDGDVHLVSLSRSSDVFMKRQASRRRASVSTRHLKEFDVFASPYGKKVSLISAHN